MGRNIADRHAGFRSIRLAGSLAILAAALLFAAPPQAGAQSAAPQLGVSRQTPAHLESCQNPANVWTGRLAAGANSSGSGSGTAMVACFPDRASCERWLGRASGAARGVIRTMTCVQSRGS